GCNLLSAAAPRCRPRPRRSGRSTASTWSRCTGKPKRRAASLPASAVLSPGRAMAGPPADAAKSKLWGTGEGCEIKVADDGEVLIRSEDLFDGYWQNDEATREIKGPDGWLRTGDIGEWGAGALRAVGAARACALPP